MKKSTQSLFLAFAVFTLLLNGCAPASTTTLPTSVPPTSTSLPKPLTFTPEPTVTNTPIPPTYTPTSPPPLCPTAMSASGAADILSPSQVIVSDQIKLYPQAGVDLGYAVPKTETDTMLAAFFEGIENERMISVNDMDWAVIDENCNELKSIGFGVHISSSDEPVIFIGELTSGSITFQAESQPLLVLIFVIPKMTQTVILRGPQGNDYSMPVSSEWLPGDDNSVAGLKLSEDGFVNVPMFGGENWAQSNASVTPNP